MHWSWHGVVALVLAVGVAVTLVLEIVNIILRDGSVTEVEATLVSTAFGAMIGALATFLGGTDDPHNHKRNNHDDEDDWI